MGIGSRSFGIECKAYYRRLNLSQHFQYWQDITLFLRLRCKNITGIEAKSKMLNVVDFNSVMCPHQFFFKLPEHSLELLDIRRILFTAVARFQKLNIFFKLCYQ